MCFCAETTEYARQLAKEPIMAFLNEAVRIYEELGGKGAKTYQYMSEVAKYKSMVNFDYLNDSDIIVVGDPETCRKKFQKYKDAGADELILRIDGMPHEKIMDCIRLLAEQVFPHLR
jgi:alkanesulfonate monooxygenase SsuD/methylene tetrahydromethanopterin reductase-like flavin-dependent oxidoreductase (luciferase family)